MTKTAHAISAMEAAVGPEEQARVQARFPTDAVFRDVLLHAYDPYLQFNAPHDLPELQPIAKLDSVDAVLAEEWPTFKAEAVAALAFEPMRVRYSASVAWPVYERVLRKGFAGVDVQTVRGVWGTIPLFDAGDVSSEPAAFPCRAMPVLSRVRRLLVVYETSATVVPGGAPMLQLFGTRGECLTPYAPVGMLASIRDEVDFRLWFAEPEYVGGVVLDGWLLQESTGPSFVAFDCVPLAVFKEQTLTAPASARAYQLRRLQEVSPYAESLKIAPWWHVASPDDEALKQIEVLASLRGVVGIDPDSPYPYRASHAWRWLRKPGE